MTSPSAPGEPGEERSPGTETGRSPAATSVEHDHERAAEPTDSGEPGERNEPGERRPATGIRWSDTETGPTPASQVGDRPPADTPAGTSGAAAPAEAGPTTEQAPAAAPAEATTEQTPVDADATPPSGLPVAHPAGPGDVVPERTTGTAPTPAPAAAWPHPGYHQGPPTWPQTTPGWAPAAAPPPPAPAPRDPARRRRVRRIVLAVVLGLVVVAAIVVALLAFLVGPRFARYDVLDPAAVERGVTDVVTRDWHRQITDVRCPDDERVRAGVSFTCSATVDGRPQQVPVDVTAGDGTYEVGQPR